MTESRCPTCHKLVAVLSDDYAGDVSLFCHRCKRGYGTAQPDDGRVSCACGKKLHAGSIRDGSLTTKCPRCRVLVMVSADGSQWIEPPRGPSKPAPPRITYPPAAPKRDYGTFPRIDRDEVLVALIEERWQARRYLESRRSVEIAVGLRFDVFARDGFRCRYCGRGPEQGVYLEADHVIPRSEGGPDTLANLVTACWDCNRGKSAKLLTAV